MLLLATRCSQLRSASSRTARASRGVQLGCPAARGVLDAGKMRNDLPIHNSMHNSRLPERCWRRRLCGSTCTRLLHCCLVSTMRLSGVPLCYSQSPC